MASKDNHLKINPLKIRVARAIKGWSLVKLEEVSGVRRKTISDFEKGVTKNIRQQTIQKLLDAFEMDIDFFITGNEKMNCGLDNIKPLQKNK